MTVLVAFAPTPEGEAAFTAGLAEAGRRGEGVLLLNTPRGGAPVSTDLAPPDLLDGLATRAADAGVVLEVSQEAHDGDLADEVLRVADAVDASVVVIGLRRRSAVGKLLLGSTEQRILLSADRPVLAVKPQHA